MFAARNTDDGWIICIRRGPPVPNWQFPNQKAAKACADELNEKHWTAWTKGYPRSKSDPILHDMIEIIESHDGTRRLQP